MQRTISWLVPFLLMFGLTLASGCGDTAVSESTDPDLIGQTDIVHNDPARDGCCILVPAGATTYDVNINGNVELGVYLYSRVSGAPSEGVRISWAIEGEGDSSLAAFESITDANGLAAMSFRAGAARTTYTVKASHPETLPVEFAVQVVDLPSGDLAVNVIDGSGGRIAVTPFDLRVYYTSDFSCRYFDPLSLRPGQIASGQAFADGDQVIFGNILAGYEYTIAGVAYGPNGNIVAKTCIDGEVVFEDAVLGVDAVFNLIPLNPVGTYKTRSFFDFGNALEESGGVGSFLITIFDGFDNPGGLLVDMLFLGCRQIAPGILCSAIESAGEWSGATEEIEEFVTDLVLSNKTGCSIVRAGCDVRAAVRTLETIGTVYMSKLGADFRLFGTTNYTGLAFYWRQDCEITDPFECGRQELTHEQILELQLISGDWQGNVTGYDHLLIESFPVDLRYGKLITYLINNVLLPRIAGGATSFSEAMEYWFDCDGFATWLSGIEIFDQHLSYDASYSVCSGAIGLLGKALNIGSALLSLQEFSSAMTLAGEVTMQDTDGDFQVDMLVDGTWGGTINFGGTASPVTGMWSGCRIDDVEDCDLPEVGFEILGDGACRCDAMCNCAE